MRALLNAAFVLLTMASIGLAADVPGPQPSPPAATPQPGAEPPALTAAAEAQALELVGRHLPELAQVLGSLKQANPPEYRKAMIELAAESRTLADLKVKYPARAAIALADWQARTRVELIAAQLASAPTPERESQLRQAIEERFEVLIRRRRFEVEQSEAAVVKLRERLAQAEANRDKTRDTLQRVEANRAARVENQYRSLLPKKPAPPPTATKPQARPAANPAPAPMPATSQLPGAVLLPALTLTDRAAFLPSPPSSTQGDSR